MKDDSELRNGLESAEAALRGARNDDALAQVSDWPEWPAELGQYGALVEAEVKLRRDGAQALALLAPLEDLFSTPEAQFRRQLLLVRAYSSVRNFDSAAVCLERAQGLVAAYPLGLRTLALFKARLRYWRGELQLDDPDLAFALGDPEPSGRLYAHSLRAWVHASRRDYRAQIDDLIVALDSYFATEPRWADVSAAAITTVSLSRIAFETAHLPGIAAAARALDTIPWTPDTAEEHMHVLRCLGLDAFMRGESHRAQWFFRDALALAPSPAFRAQCHLDRALVARIGGNEPWALDEIFEAERESSQVAWGNTFGEERMILAIFAMMYAPVDSGRAHYYAAVYSRLGLANINPNFAMSRDPRARALELQARGSIEQTLGDRAQATNTLTTVYDTFDAIGHHYRAATAALSLVALSSAPQWAERARKHIAPYGEDCPLGLSLQSRQESAAEETPDSLTPFQRQLLRALVLGEDLDRISRRFSRSTYTITKQVEHIYSRLGVTSLHALRREARRKGIA